MEMVSVYAANGAHIPSVEARAVVQPLQVEAVLVGGDLLFREGLKRLLSDSPVVVVGEAESLAELLDTPSLALRPHLVMLLDVPMEEGAFSTQFKSLDALWPEARSVILASKAQIGSLAMAVSAGVSGYLLKDMSPEALLQSIKLVMMGENVFPTRLTAELLGGSTAMPARGVSARAPNLTPRELDILDGLLDGQSNKAIAAHLGITEATVKAQLRHLLRKIGAENRTQAALWAMENHVERRA